MRRLSIVLAVAVAVCAPAAAQRAGLPAPLPALDSRGPAPGPYRDAADVRARIDEGRHAGQLSRRAARRLRRGTDQFDTLTDRYGAGGLSDAERRELDARAWVLRDQVNAARRPR